MVTLNHMLNLNSKIRIPDGIYESTSPLLPSPHPSLLCLSILYPLAHRYLHSAVSPVGAFICFLKSPLLGPLNSSACISCIPASISVFLEAWYKYKQKYKYKTNKNKENKKLTEYYHKLKERDHERKEKVIFSCLQWHFFFLLFECLLVPANSIARLV